MLRVTDQTVQLARRIYRRLQDSPEPLKRAELAGLVENPLMKQSTKERRVREARAYLVSQGVAILSDGRGFRLAKTAKEYADAIRLKEKAAVSALVEVAYLKRMKPKDYVKQILPFLEGAL